MHETHCLEINVMRVQMFEIARGALDLMINGENQILRRKTDTPNYIEQ